MSPTTHKILFIKKPTTHLILEQPLTFLKKVRYVGVENLKFFKRTRQESD
jgi:hypothetical protein